MLYVLVLAGHGEDTKGKRSPLKEDGSRFYEWKSNKEIAIRLVTKLTGIDGVKPLLINPDKKDISLAGRAKLVNTVCRAYGAKNCILVEIHSDAAGDGSKWMNGRGWACWTTKGETISDGLAECMYDTAESIFLKDEKLTGSYKGTKAKPVRTDFTDKGKADRDYENDFYVIKQASCAAVLVENFFYDNRKDLEYLESENGKEKITEVLMQGVLKWKEIKKL